MEILVKFPETLRLIPKLPFSSFFIEIVLKNFTIEVNDTDLLVYVWNMLLLEQKDRIIQSLMTEIQFLKCESNEIIEPTEELETPKSIFISKFLKFFDVKQVNLDDGTLPDAIREILEDT